MVACCNCSIQQKFELREIGNFVLPTYHKFFQVKRLELYGRNVSRRRLDRVGEQQPVHELPLSQTGGNSGAKRRTAVEETDRDSGDLEFFFNGR
ncbi:hypothetical protein AAHA92_25027 [Salvia divinorum]|uniref:Uncharacterized protein n=1 Tax=Salvia divinorum TaxID=28513 RepID=A0ABD1G9A7_SALDI